MCISILHEPGDDKWGYEKASERWLPVHTVETILISVISMLADPNDESPANVDAAVSVPYLYCDITLRRTQYVHVKYVFVLHHKEYYEINVDVYTWCSKVGFTGH